MSEEEEEERLTIIERKWKERSNINVHVQVSITSGVCLCKSMSHLDDGLTRVSRLPHVSLALPSIITHFLFLERSDTVYFFR